MREKEQSQGDALGSFLYFFLAARLRLWRAEFWEENPAIIFQLNLLCILNKINFPDLFRLPIDFSIVFCYT